MGRFHADRDAIPLDEIKTEYSVSFNCKLDTLLLNVYIVVRTNLRDDTSGINLKKANFIASCHGFADFENYLLN